MLALYRSGRQADALETFQEARSVLADELGLEPGPELRRLQEAILAHDPAIAAVPVDPRRRGNLPAPSTSFVGREDELAYVSGLLREHRLVTLTGPPGVGKSRLAVETARSLEREVPERHLAGRPCARGRRNDVVDSYARRRRAWLDPACTRDVRGFDLRACSSFSTRASRSRRGCTHRVGAPGRVSRRPDPDDEPRGAPRHERGALFPLRL
jgi:hypothetical protein